MDEITAWLVLVLLFVVVMGGYVWLADRWLLPWLQDLTWRLMRRRALKAGFTDEEIDEAIATARARRK